MENSYKMLYELKNSLYRDESKTDVVDYPRPQNNNAHEYVGVTVLSRNPTHNGE